MVVCLGDGLKEKILNQMKEIDINGKNRVIIMYLKEALNTACHTKILTA